MEYLVIIYGLIIHCTLHSSVDIVVLIIHIYTNTMDSVYFVLVTVFI